LRDRHARQDGLGEYENEPENGPEYDATMRHGFPLPGRWIDAPHNGCFIAAAREKYYKRQRDDAVRPAAKIVLVCAIESSPTRIKNQMEEANA
jgi:hypothetical protein